MSIRLAPAHPVLRRGFVIMEINRKPTATVADYERVVGAARTGDVLADLLLRSDEWDSDRS